MISESNFVSRYKVFILAFVLVLAIGAYFYSTYARVNHLIEGVPYYGIFNLYAEYTTTATSMATILHYYNDDRISFEELKDEFRHPQKRDEEDLESNFDKSLTFFKDLGYETVSINLSDEGNEVSEIKKYIKKDIPVIVVQQKRLDTKVDDIEKYGWRVVIGVFDDKKEIIIHDSYLGNNYILSFEEFENLFVRGASRMLAVWPSDMLANSLPKPGSGMPYPERSVAMETAYEAIGAAGRARTLASESDELCANSLDDPSPSQISEYIRLNRESIRYRDEVINSPSFSIMSPIFQFHNKLWKAKSLMRIGEISKARAILTNELIPENKNLDKLANGGEFADGIPENTSIKSDRLINGQMPYVYELLMHTYRFEGKYNEAINAYMPYFKLDPDDDDALRRLSELRDPSQRELLPNPVKCMGGRSVLK